MFSFFNGNDSKKKKKVELKNKVFNVFNMKHIR